MPHDIPIEAIEEMRFNPRDFSREEAIRKLKQLEESIKRFGFFSPLNIYRKVGSDLFGIMDGHRRFFCAKRLGLASVPCYIHNHGTRLTEEEALQVMFEMQVQHEVWRPRDVGEIICRTQKENISLEIPKRYKGKAKVLAMSPPWLQKMILTNGRAGIGWTIVRDIYKFTRDEDEVRDLVYLYVSGQIPTQKDLYAFMKEYFGETLETKHKTTLVSLPA